VVVNLPEGFIFAEKRACEQKSKRRHCADVLHIEAKGKPGQGKA
jgi:hypothetical protein